MGDLGRGTGDRGTGDRGKSSPGRQDFRSSACKQTHVKRDPEGPWTGCFPAHTRTTYSISEELFSWRVISGSHMTAGAARVRSPQQRVDGEGGPRGAEGEVYEHM